MRLERTKIIIITGPTLNCSLIDRTLLVRLVLFISIIPNAEDGEEFEANFCITYYLLC